MKTPRIVLILVSAGLALARLSAADANEPIDWNRARELHQKQQRGATLTSEERAYLDRATAARRQQNGPGELGPAILQSLSSEEREQVREMMRKRRAGEPLSDSDRALEQKVRSLMAARQSSPRSAAGEPSTPAPRDTTGLVPLTEMTTGQTYQGRDGGLYGGGQNEPPAAHRAAAMAEAARIVPLNRDGQPAKDGKIVLLSVGMSNTTQEFSRFKEFADRDAQKSPNVMIVDGAQGGQTAAAWAKSGDSEIWRKVDARLEAAGVTPRQVEVVWMKHANARPTEPFPAHAEKLESDLTTVLHLLKTKFPNLRIAYLSSRIYAGYANGPLNPEPYAYESAFAVRDLIQKQISGDAALNYDAKKGEVNSPLLLWGPYLWADGMKPRQRDGLIWKREDLGPDGTHPSPTSGRDKVAQQLLAFLKNDSTAKRWFVAQ